MFTSLIAHTIILPAGLRAPATPLSPAARVPPAPPTPPLSPCTRLWRLMCPFPTLEQVRNAEA